MHVYYINPDSSAERAAKFEENFAKCNFTPDWKCFRYPARTPLSEGVADFPGNVSLVIKALYLSVVDCINKSQIEDDHVIVCEDDMRFSPITEACLNEVISGLDAKGISWDVLMLDAIMSDAIHMPALMKMRRRCIEKGVISLIDVAKWSMPHVSCACFVVNKTSKSEVLQSIRFNRLDYVHDLLIREVIRSGAIRGYVTFPYLATVDQIGDKSSVREVDGSVASWDAQNLLWNYFRRLIWIDGELEKEGLMRLLDIPPEGSTRDQIEVKILLELMGRLLQEQLGWGQDPVITVASVALKEHCA